MGATGVESNAVGDFLDVGAVGTEDEGVFGEESLASGVVKVTTVY